MADFLNLIVKDIRKTISEGYYNLLYCLPSSKSCLTDSIDKNERPSIITEIKMASPSKGTITNCLDVEKLAKKMELGGAIGISILTEPLYFKGSLESFIKVRKRVSLPLLMKDFILQPVQLEAASRMGANTVLLISAIFRRGFADIGLDEMIEISHSKNIEVLLETHTEDEFEKAFGTEADLIGINNRNLGNLQVDLKTTQRLLKKVGSRDRIIVSESGIQTPSDIRFLHQCGIDAFLIGSAIMQSIEIEEKIRSLMAAL